MSLPINHPAKRILPGDPFILERPAKYHFLLFYQTGLSFGTNLGQIAFPEELYYGQTVMTSLRHPFQILMPSLADLQMKVKRRTTIIYPKDAGYMLLQTGIREGSRVLECGSGSGAFTFLLACVVGKTGRICSYERRPEHLDQAKENLKRLGEFPQIEWHLRDTETEGFGQDGVEAAFIDVPEPWTLVGPAREALWPGGFWVSLSPNYNQVEKTVFALEAASFTGIRTVEILEREILVRPEKTRPKEMGITHTAFITSARRAEPFAGTEPAPKPEQKEHYEQSE
jgi:tRNA (adenine57-N1/adenine58-N1)-methyltransferase